MRFWRRGGAEPAEDAGGRQDDGLEPGRTDAPDEEASDVAPDAVDEGLMEPAEAVAGPSESVPLEAADEPAPPAEAADLAAGLQKSRRGFVSRLRGFLSASSGGPDWDDVEETLIAGDVGGVLAM